MTKEEVINKIIERYKSYKNKSFVNLVDCCGMDCDNCPFKVTECADDVIKAIIERLVKAEGKAETNLEHFRGNVAFDKTNGIVHIHLINGWKKSYSDDKGAIDWLLSPYEPPKYKLTQFEYDLLKSYGEETESTDIFCYYSLTMMREKGYFKDIQVTATFGDVLDNCEVMRECG